MIPLSVFDFFFFHVYIFHLYILIFIFYFFLVRSRISLGENGRKSKNDESKDRFMLIWELMVSFCYFFCFDQSIDVT